jgi:hypothetical protein
MSDESAYYLEFVIAQALSSGERHSHTLSDGTLVYAYPHANGIAWGINEGANILRGIRKDDGSDIAVS